jgi:hypothetical protein
MSSENHFSEPTTSIWPFILAVGISMIVIGLLASLVLSVVGVVVVIVALAGWTQEVRALAPYLEEPQDEEPGDE